MPADLSAKELLVLIERLPASLPFADRIVMRRPHKQHWIGWLSEYDGPGHYGRRRPMPQQASFVYNHLHCSGMLIWLAEGVGVDQALIQQAADLPIRLHGSFPADAIAVRRILPWEIVAEAISHL